jgi:hypothetical protein
LTARASAAVGSLPPVPATISLGALEGVKATPNRLAVDLGLGGEVAPRRFRCMFPVCSFLGGRDPVLAAELHGDVLSDDHVADNASVWTANFIRGKLDPDSCGAEDSLKGRAAVLGLLAGLSNSACDDARVGGYFPLHEQASDWGSNARPEIHFVGDNSTLFVLDSVIAILPVVLLRQKTAAAK